MTQMVLLSKPSNPMSVLSEIFGSEIGKKQDREIAQQITMTVGDLLKEEKYSKEVLVKAINTVLQKWSKEKENKQLVKYVYADLVELFPTIHEKYHFFINPSH